MDFALKQTLPAQMGRSLSLQINKNEKARRYAGLFYQYVISSLPAVLKHPTVPVELIGAIDAFTLPADTSVQPDATVAPQPDGFCWKVTKFPLINSWH